MFDKLRVWLASRLRKRTPAVPDRDADAALGDLIRTLTTELRTCKRQVSIVVAAEDKLKQQVARHANAVTKLQVEALKAAGAGQDERALDLIRKRKRYEATAKGLERQLAKHRSVSDTIQETVRKIELKIEEARRKKLLLATQRQAYETSRRLSDGLHAPGGGNLLDEIEDDVTFLQTETRLALDIDVDRIGIEEAGLDDHDEPDLISEGEELAALKARLEPGAAPPLLEGPSPEYAEDAADLTDASGEPDAGTAEDSTAEDSTDGTRNEAAEGDPDQGPDGEPDERPDAPVEKPASPRPPLIIDDEGDDDGDTTDDVLVIGDTGERPSRQRPRRNRPPTDDIVFIDDDE